MSPSLYAENKPMLKPMDPEKAKERSATLARLLEKLGADSGRVLKQRRDALHPVAEVTEVEAHKLAEGGEAGEDMPHKGRDPEEGNHKTSPMPGNYAKGGEAEPELGEKPLPAPEPERERHLPPDSELGKGGKKDPEDAAHAELVRRLLDGNY